MEGGPAERATGFPALFGKILIDLMEKTKKTDVVKKFW